MSSSSKVSSNPVLNNGGVAGGDAERQPSDLLGSEASGTRSRSCIHCRSRKVKCDRLIPCTGCVRSGAKCTYPAGPGRAPKRARRAVDSRVLDRLSRLEGLMNQMGSDKHEASPHAETSLLQSNKPSLQADLTSEDEPNSIGQQLGRLVVDDTRSCYVSNKLWANLTSEIEELRDLLYDQSSDQEKYSPNDDTNQPVQSSALNLSSNNMIMGGQTVDSQHSSMRSYHPPLSQSVALIEIFKNKVHPLVHIFHTPTLMRDYWNAVESLDNLDRNAEALLFSIYYSSIISMEPEECVNIVGLSREVALKHYQFAVQQAIARADFLNTQSMTLIQAVVLFLSALKNVDASRRTWSLTALVFHIARAMGLHRDGKAFGLPPFETEMRRRLWWHICFLDIRSSEHHGCEPIVQDSAFDTRTPLNVNDDDLVHGMTKPPREHEGATEMTFILLRSEVLRAAWKTSYISFGEMLSDQNKQKQTLQSPEKIAEDLEERLENRYIKYCDPSNPFFKMCMTVGRLMISRIWLVSHYPTKHNSGTDSSATVSDKMFLTAIKILELSTSLITSPDISQWKWHSKTHIQWHSLALVLAEICSRPPSAECDRAWECANAVYKRWNMQTPDKTNPWRKIERLMARAQYVRGTQNNNELGQHLNVSDSRNMKPSHTAKMEDLEFTIGDFQQSKSFFSGNQDCDGSDDQFLLESAEIFNQDLLNGYGHFESMYNDYVMGDWSGGGLDVNYDSNGK